MEEISERHIVKSYDEELPSEKESHYKSYPYIACPHPFFSCHNIIVRVPRFKPTRFD